MVDKLVRGFIERFQRSVPVDLVRFATQLGIRVYESKPGEFPMGIAGKIVKDASHGGQGGYSIFVRTEDPYVRKRFTMAHEIAHYLLHRPHIGNGITDDALYRSQLSDRKEFEANALAADLLMPWHLLNSMDPNLSLVDLATKFQVSTRAMQIRLESRGMGARQIVAIRSTPATSTK